MEDKLTKPRAKCSRCKRKRNIEEMTLVFKHPVLNPDGVYLCTNKHWKYGHCLVQMIPEIMMYAETGIIKISK